MNNIGSRKLYKYVPIYAAKRILKEGKIRCTSPILLNDPFDGQLKPPRPFSEGELQNYMAKKVSKFVWDEEKAPENASGTFNAYLKQLKEHYTTKLSREDAIKYTSSYMHLADGLGNWDPTSQMEKKWLSSQREFRLTSFSDKNNEITMWSHYADNHRGACLEFTDVTDGSLVRKAKKVTYIDKLPTFASLEEWGNFLLGLGQFDIIIRITDYLLHKSNAWKAEQEYRILFRKEKADDLYCFLDIAPNELTGVYLGTRILEIDKQTIISLCSGTYLKTNLFQAQTSNQKFALDFKKLQENT